VRMLCEALDLHPIRVDLLRSNSRLPRDDHAQKFADCS
jgi:hypothetical protein